MPRTPLALPFPCAWDDTLQCPCSWGNWVNPAGLGFPGRGAISQADSRASKGREWEAPQELHTPSLQGPPGHPEQHFVSRSPWLLPLKVTHNTKPRGLLLQSREGMRERAISLPTPHRAPRYLAELQVPRARMQGRGFGLRLCAVGTPGAMHARARLNRGRSSSPRASAGVALHVTPAFCSKI